MKEKREERRGEELLGGTGPTFRVVLSSEGRGPVLGEGEAGSRFGWLVSDGT